MDKVQKLAEGIYETLSQHDVFIQLGVEVDQFNFVSIYSKEDIDKQWGPDKYALNVLREALLNGLSKLE